MEIAEPDDMLLGGVIHKLFADRQISVEPHVVSYLVSRIERSLLSAIQIVDRLDRAALEQKNPYHPYAGRTGVVRSRSR